MQIMVRKLTPRLEAKKPIGASEADTSKQFALKFSEFELLVAIDVIRSAIVEHRKHLDLEVLRSVLAKLTGAYDRERGSRPLQRSAAPRPGIDPVDDPAETPLTLILSSGAFADGHPIPRRFTREGGNVSPPLRWHGAPRGTRSHALIVEDPDAPSGTFRHWAVYDIPGNATELAEGIGSQKAIPALRVAVNDFGDRRYDGPEPPHGHGVHHYHFRLFALDVPQLSVPTNASARDVLEVARAHSLAEADFVGTYAR